VKPLEQDRKLLALTPDECQLRSVNPGAHASDPDRRLFTVRVAGRGWLLSKQYFQFWRGTKCRAFARL
jgi:hypothetical protein